MQMAPMETEETNLLLYNATLSLYRLSPLHCPSSVRLSNPRSLATHARRLSDALKGDVLQGIRVHVDDKSDSLGRSGALKGCRWTWISPGKGDSRSGGADGFGTTEGILVEIEYEKSTYVAWLLRSYSTAPQEMTGRIHLPLLGLRMPNALREMFLNYLGSTFDARVDTLHIGSNEIGRATEGYLETCARYPDQVLLRLVKDVQLSFSFKAPISPSLRSLDITIKREDLTKFMKEGERVKAERPRSARGPFLSAVCKYLETQLAIDADHKDVLIGRIACGQFALGREGKVKLFTPFFEDDDENILAASKEANTDLIAQLLNLAAGQGNGPTAS